MDSANAINYVTGATYGPDSALTGFISGNSGSFAGVASKFFYTPRLQPCRMLAGTGTLPGNCADAGHANTFDIAYDFHSGNGNNGNVWGITNNKDTSRNQSFTYDVLNRLTSAQNAGTDCSVHLVDGHTKFWGNTYGYDAWGNLLQKTPTRCTPENLGVIADGKNQLHTGTSPDYAYDAAGNMTLDVTDGVAATYDAESRISTTVNRGMTTTYLYDADGNRVNKSSGTLYWYMTPGIVAESDLAGTLKSEYVFFGGERVARRDLVAPTGVSYYFSDHLKTASVITDSGGNIKAESDYYPWGGELQFVNADSNHYKFTGKERDSETNLDYFGARYYGNALGRFLVPDWAAKPVTVPYANFGNPQSLNLYSYVSNNPMTMADADGHEGGLTYNHDGSITSPVDAHTDGHPIRDTLILGAYTVTALAAPEAGPLLRGLYYLGFATAPRTVPIIVNALDGMTPGPSGTLTISTATRLTATEISTGVRLAEQTGTRLVQSEHVGAEFVDSAGKTYDAVNSPAAYQNWATQSKNILENIRTTANKAVDHVAVELKGASKDQVTAIKDFVKTLTKKQRDKIIYVK